MHSVMSRVYHPGYKCALCKNLPQFGWVYRCTHDRDGLIMGAELKDDEAGGQPYHHSPTANPSGTTQVYFDEIGRAFANEMNLGKFGPDMRTQKYSFLNEITTDQLHTYTPSQVALILSQRDHVADIIAESLQKPGQQCPDYNIPWVVDENKECQYKVCHYCHRIGEDKSWVSLNGVVNGDILPTVATGYSFSYTQSRPLVDAEVAKNLGCRPVPFPYYHTVNLGRRAREGWDDVEDHIDAWFQPDSPDGNDDHRTEVAPAQEDDSGDDDDDSVSVSASDSDESLDIEDDKAADWTPPSQEHVEDVHSGKLDSGTPGPSEISVQDHYHAVLSACFPLRPPWTPPPTPSDILEEAYHEAMDMGHACNGRSTSSLKTNSAVRARLFSSFPSISMVLRQESDREYRTEEMCDVGLVLPLDDALLKRACGIRLPRPDLDEEFLFAKGKISIGDFKHMQAFVNAATTDGAPPPAVIHSPDDKVAVAPMTKESVETGVPDIVLHVEENNGVTARDMGQTN